MTNFQLAALLQLLLLELRRWKWVCGLSSLNLQGSYNWDYLPNWCPQFQPLANSFYINWQALRAYNNPYRPFQPKRAMNPNHAKQNTLHSGTEPLIFLYLSINGKQETNMSRWFSSGLSRLLPPNVCVYSDLDSDLASSVTGLSFGTFMTLTWLKKLLKVTEWTNYYKAIQWHFLDRSSHHHYYILDTVQTILKHHKFLKYYQIIVIVVVNPKKLLRKMISHV